MTEPLSTMIGAKILDQLLGKAVGKAMDTALGGASKAMKDARAELDKETVQRAARMALIVEKAAEELQPALEQIKIDTGQDHSALFQHPPFLAQVAQALLTNLTLDVDAFRAEYQAMFADGQWADLAEPLDLFFAQLKLLGQPVAGVAQGAAGQAQPAACRDLRDEPGLQPAGAAGRVGGAALPARPLRHLCHPRAQAAADTCTCAALRRTWRCQRGALPRPRGASRTLQCDRTAVRAALHRRQLRRFLGLFLLRAAEPDRPRRHCSAVQAFSK